MGAPTQGTYETVGQFRIRVTNYQLRLYKGWATVWEKFITESPDRPQEVVLYELLTETMYTARKEGWDEPSEDDLKAALGADTKSSYFYQFQDSYLEAKSNLELAAYKLGIELKRPAYATAMADRNDKQAILDEISEIQQALSRTERGKHELADFLKVETSPIHPLNLVKPSNLAPYLNQKDEFDFDQKSEKLFPMVKSVIKLVKSSLSGFTVVFARTSNLALATNTLVEVLKRFDSDLEGIDYDKIITNAETGKIELAADELSEAGDKLKAKVEAYRTVKKWGSIVGQVSSLASLISFFGTAVKAIKDPSFVNVGNAVTGFIRQIKFLTDSAKAVAKKYKKLFPKDGLKKAGKEATKEGAEAAWKLGAGAKKFGKEVIEFILGPLMDIWDVVTNTISGIGAYTRGDYSATAGYALQGVSAGMMVVLGIYKIAAGATLTGIGAWLGLLALVIGTIGFILTWLTSEHPLELFFEHSRFGTEWESNLKAVDYDFFEDPAQPYFKWRTPVGGSPKVKTQPWHTEENIARQASELMSTMTPLKLKPKVEDSPGISGPQPWKTKASPSNMSAWPAQQGSITLNVPKQVDDNSYVVVKGLYHVTGQGIKSLWQSDHFVVEPLWYTHLKDGSTLHELGGAVPEQTYIHRFEEKEDESSNDPPVKKCKILFAEPASQKNMLFGRNELPEWVEVDIVQSNPFAVGDLFDPKRDLRMTDYELVVRDRAELEGN